MESHTDVFDEAGVLRSDIREEATNVSPTELFPCWLIVSSGFGVIVTKDEAILAIEKHASFAVDNFVDTKERS